MKKSTFIRRSLCLISATLLMATACKKKDTKPDEDTPGAASVETRMVTSLEASEKVYLNLSTGEQIAEASVNATNWDISFYGKDRAIVVAVNSGSEGSGTAGAQLVSTGFDDLTQAPESGYLPGKDATGDYLKWSNYTGSTTDPKHAVLPKPGMCIVVKTADGKYSKIQLLSLYKGNPNTSTAEFADLATRPAFGYFTFRYATQTNGSRNF
jgi:hypothetical protein